MYNEAVITQLIKRIKENNGIGDKTKLAQIISTEFNLTKNRAVYSNTDFAIRFSKSNQRKMCNTVLSLSTLRQYDSIPFFVCIVTPTENYLLLSNTTFLCRIGHSSQALRVDNVRGSFNGNDIVPSFSGIENIPDNFKNLYAFHEGNSFESNLERLVESTNMIKGRMQKYEVSELQKDLIMKSVDRAIDFINSPQYDDLRKDLDLRVSRAQGEIAIAAFIENVNLRGRIIEYLITDNGTSLKDQIISALHNHQALPKFETKDGLGDYTKVYDEYCTETDIKTKIMFLDGNPKAYNIDKLLEFLCEDKSVYMIYVLGIGEKCEITARLCSVFDNRLIENTSIVYHWAGRNSRGVTQFIGHGLVQILNKDSKTQVAEKEAKEFLKKLISL